MNQEASSREERLSALPFEVIFPTKRSALRNVSEDFRRLFKRRNLLILFVKSDLQSRYKNSALGIFWALLRPMVLLAIYYFAIGKILGADRSIPSFAIFVFTGLTLWGFFAESVSQGATSILRASGLIKKVDVPREFFPLAAVGSAGINFAFQLLILLVATVLLGQVPLHWELLLALPAVTITLLFSTAIAMLTSALTVFFRDLQYLVEVLLLIGFWLTPLVYSLGLVVSVLPDSPMGTVAEQIFLANPITVAVLGFQEAFWVQGDFASIPISLTELLTRMLVSIIVGLLLLLFSSRLFGRMEGNFAQEL